MDFEGLRDSNVTTSPSSSKPMKRAMRVTIPSNPSGRLGVVFGCGDVDGRPIVKRFDLVLLFAFHALLKQLFYFHMFTLEHLRAN